MPIIDSIKEILIGSVIIITFVSIGSVIEYLREQYDDKIKKKAVKEDKKEIGEKAVDEYEDGHYEGDMN